jgi:Ca2+-transporting ATPase
VSVEKWYALDSAEIADRLGTDLLQGLSEAEAVRRWKEHGPNELEERGLKSKWRILWEQLTDTMVVILIIAGVVSAAMGDLKDTGAILVIVVLNALLGFRQEYKAERAMAALKALAVPSVRALRDGKVREVSARELVVGDVVLLEAGNLVSADGRLLETVNLRIQEAALTGESEPVEKISSTLPDRGTDVDVPLADRRNMAYMGTVVTYGRGRMIVSETGMHTELGRIAAMIQTLGGGATPLQKRLSQLGHGLAFAALVLVSIVFGLGLSRGEDLKEMFFIGISMAVAAIPEGLPAVVTIALALGSQRMLKRRALIRKLPAVETLGSVTAICSDKTGTLTQNRMTVEILAFAEGSIDLKQDLVGSHPVRNLLSERANSQNGHYEGNPSVVLLLMGGALCNDARIESRGGEGTEEFAAIGDPTETALVIAAGQFGLRKFELEAAFPRISELPFDSDRKRMTTIHRLPLSDPSASGLPDIFRGEAGQGPSPSHIGFTKGAVDSILGLSDKILIKDRMEPMTREWTELIVAANNRMARSGMRVLGVALRPLPSYPLQDEAQVPECDLTFIGMLGLIDPARPEVKQAVATCKSAGIRPLMITGDHPLTAQYIARDLGIDSNGRVITGQDLARMSVEELEGVVEKVSVYARVSPEHKLNIVQALQKRNHIVAMTGDGVNDAPALKKADIGVAMGITGTDVTKEVADMVLLDDNFATIVAAVEEGRVIYDNIRKFIKYLLTSNSGEIWVMLLAPFLGMPLPLLPLQILWINLVTDGLPALALGLEPAEPDIMRRPPYRPTENIFGGGMGRHIIWVGFLMGLVPLLAGYWHWTQANPRWQTITFTILTLAQLGHALAIRSTKYSLFTIGLFSNKSLLGAVLLTFLMQVAAVYVPFLQGFLRTVDLPWQELVQCIILGTAVFWAVEIEKWLIRWSERRRRGEDEAHSVGGK